ncbi:hypothetical protein A2Z33_01930 [Candidatus Gottesmanbacteria bacterium RBG_16_52_11]|uniref:Uncharacterized protein n=1 Tax=Candidatus Gottesmanbacteria bacterium RBG_16_52_11 TaxID=1798374 RepID=A0A1F5YR04_9BACT|nr:MAG: hypothetical protein A2Z33_01930 [Candidatus Gottesmanbacteria bacterium RBG_16_52_11]
MLLVLLILFLAALIALYVLSRLLTNALFTSLFLVTRSRSFAVTAVIALTFPGTVIHELSHLFVAEILGVRTGKLTLVPENIRDKEINTGSVSIVRTDPLRRHAIGLAPMYVGTLVLTALSYIIPGFWQALLDTEPARLIETPNTYLFLLVAYFIFAVSNAMFSSRRDLEGFPAFAITLAIFGAAFWIAGFRIQLPQPVTDTAARTVITLVQSLGLVIASNLMILIVLKLWIRLLTGFMGVRIKHG